MTPEGDSPYIYRSAAYRAASIASAVFLLAIGLGIAAFSSSVEGVPNTRFVIIDGVVTLLTATWMALGARVRIEMGDGVVRVATKTRNGQFPAEQVERFECRPGKLGGLPLGSSYVHLVLADDAPKSPGVRDRALNSWSPSPGPVERSKQLLKLNAALASLRASAPSAAGSNDASTEAAADDPASEGGEVG